MNLAIVSLHDENMIEIGEISTPNFQRYGKRWNHDVIIHERSLNPRRHPSWSKIPALIEALKTGRYDWVFWIDCDALFMNHAVSLESKILEGIHHYRSERSQLRGPFAEPDIIFSSDFNGIACGSMFVRHCQWALDFLSAINVCGELVNSNPDGHGNKWEQNTIKHLLQNFPDLGGRAISLPQHSTNYHYHNHDFIVGALILQFPVLSNKERIQAMKEMVPAVRS